MGEFRRSFWQVAEPNNQQVKHAAQHTGSLTNKRQFLKNITSRTPWVWLGTSELCARASSVSPPRPLLGWVETGLNVNRLYFLVRGSFPVSDRGRLLVDFGWTSFCFLGAAGFACKVGFRLFVGALDIVLLELELDVLVVRNTEKTANVDSANWWRECFTNWWETNDHKLRQSGKIPMWFNTAMFDRTEFEHCFIIVEFFWSCTVELYHQEAV